MNQKALKTLEYDKIIHRLTGHAASAGAKERCEKLQPSASLWEIERAQTQTADALRRIWQKGRQMSWQMFRLKSESTIL